MISAGELPGVVLPVSRTPCLLETRQFIVKRITPPKYNSNGGAKGVNRNWGDFYGNQDLFGRLWESYPERSASDPESEGWEG